MADDTFDLELYLIAEDTTTGSYDGLVRVWNRAPLPRLGCLGVRGGARDHRDRRCQQWFVCDGSQARNDGESDDGVGEVRSPPTNGRARDTHQMKRSCGGDISTELSHERRQIDDHTPLNAKSHTSPRPVARIGSGVPWTVPSVVLDCPVLRARRAWRCPVGHALGAAVASRRSV